ncbi:MAG: membrane dipeptidase [Polyangiales bacterium]
MEEAAQLRLAGGDDVAFAARLGVSQGALDVLRASEVIDLHVDSFIWTRIFGYDLQASHGRGALNGWLFSQFDLPRAARGGLTGAMWSITTNPWRSAEGRARVLAENVERLTQLLEAGGRARVVRTASELRRARAEGLHAALLAVQGGNAFDRDEHVLASGAITRVTLVHMTNSAVGATSSPLRLGADRGLGPRGRELVERANQSRTFVDLAHISRRGFFEAAEIHDRSQPLLVTHTGVSAVHPSWRNLDDAQIKRVADTGGVIGVVFHGEYLSGSFFGGPVEPIAAHLAHIVNVGGEDAAAIGSDWDGAIVPPAAIRSCEQLPRVVQALLDRGLPERVVHKLLGANFLRAFGQLRP